MKNLLSPFYQSTARRFLGGIVGLSLMALPALQAQTNFDFNASTAPGWENWLPENYNVPADAAACYIGTGCFTNGANQPSVTFTTNNSSAGNMAMHFHSGTTNVQGDRPPIMASLTTNGTPFNNFTMTVDLINWTNGQSQGMGLCARMKLPWPPINEPGSESLSYPSAPQGLQLLFHNYGSYSEFNNNFTQKDYLRIHWVPPQFPLRANLVGGDFNHTGTSYQYPGRSYTYTNGHYRLIFTGNELDLTAQLVDIDTGIPLTMSGPTNGHAWFTNNYSPPYGYVYYENSTILRTTAYKQFTDYGANPPMVYTAYLTNNGAIFTNAVGETPVLSDVPAAGSAYGMSVTIADNGYSATTGNPKKGQPFDPTFDNFGIVQGVVTLESCATVNGTYTQNLRAGIELNPKRITVATSGNQEFYRIKWIGCDHIPTITSATFNGNVTVVQEVPDPANPPYYIVVTNAVKKLVLTYN